MIAEKLKESRTSHGYTQAFLSKELKIGQSAKILSVGGEGALITDGKSAYRTPGLKVEVKSTVAAGDSMIAGLAVGFRRGFGLDDAFRLGVAAATARCMTPPDEIIAAETCLKLSEKLKMEKLI